MKTKKILKRVGIAFAILIAIVIVLFAAVVISLIIDGNRAEKEITAARKYVLNYLENKYPDDNFSDWEYEEYDKFAGLELYQENGHYNSGSGKVKSEKYGVFSYSYSLNDYVSSSYYKFTFQPKIEEYVNNLLLELPEDIRKKYNYSLTASFTYDSNIMTAFFRDNYEDWEIGDVLAKNETLYIDINVENDELSETDKQEFMDSIINILYNNPDISYPNDRNYTSYYNIYFIFSDGKTICVSIHTDGNIYQTDITESKPQE
jgi:hypothetical protein